MGITCLFPFPSLHPGSGTGGSDKRKWAPGAKAVASLPTQRVLL